VLDLLPWNRSTVMDFAPNVEGQPPAWIVPLVADREPNSPCGHVVSFIRHHERGFIAPASRFMRELCHHYRLESHNFAPNAISQAATFVGICEGFLGIPVNWDLWVDLFRAELHTLTTHEPRVRRVVRAGGLSILLRDSRREFYIPCTMTSNNAEWERGWFYLRNDGPGLPYTRKVLEEKADSWHHDLSPSSRQDRLQSILLALKGLADTGLGAASVLANLHHRRIVPLMERELHIYEMSETTNPISLARSRLLHDRFPPEYAATRARRANSLKAIRHGNDDLLSFIMLPDALTVSRLPFLYSLATRRCDSNISLFLAEGGRGRRAVRPAHAPSPSARGAAAGARVGGTQEGAEDPAARKERRIQRWECWEQQDEEYRLREQQGLFPLATSEYSSLREGEEEESNGG
jgi:hypothetical protein